MPTYEYRCPEGHTFELFQKMSDEPGAACPECGKPAERQISAGAGFLFKGDGFYITDYRSESYRKKAEAEKGAKPETGKAGSAGSGSDAGSSSGGDKGDKGAPAPAEKKPSAGSSTGGSSSGGAAT